jgi:hypothetical protein
LILQKEIYVERLWFLLSILPRLLVFILILSAQQQGMEAWEESLQ